MKEKRFTLRDEFIELIKLLKLLNLAESGAHAKILVDEGEVKVNGETEYRKRAKIRSGDLVQCNDVQIIVVANTKK